MAAAFMGVASMAVVDDMGDRIYPGVELGEFKNGGKT